MRLLAEMQRVYSAARTVCDVQNVRMDTMTTAANRRDVYIRWIQATGGTMNVYAFDTLDHANTAIVVADFVGKPTAQAAAGVLAYYEGITTSPNARTITLTDLAGTSPDMSGLGIGGIFVGDAGGFSAVYAYTASPEALVLGEIEAALGTRVSAGQILDGYTLTRVVKGPSGIQVMDQAPQIVTTATESPEIMHTNDDRYALAVLFEVYIGNRNIADYETNYMDVTRVAGSVRSLLGDELHKLNMETSGSHKVVITGLRGPEFLGEGEAYMGATITGLVRFPLLFSDRSS